MSERRQPGSSYESWIDRKIREAEERGDFDDLPGAGKPLPDLDHPRDDLWWVKKLMRREQLSITPPVVELRLKREEALRRIARASSEADVRRIVAEVNTLIGEFNATATTGASLHVAPIDLAAVLQRRREQR